MVKSLSDRIHPKRANRVPVYEPIAPPPAESFVWRCDDYPLPWTVWNNHPECEIHFIRNATFSFRIVLRSWKARHFLSRTDLYPWITMINPVTRQIATLSGPEP